MSNEIQSFSLNVDALEKRVLAIDKNNLNNIEAIKKDILELLSKLKRKQDEILNEDDENTYEDLVARVIVLLGEFDTKL